jgi:hypothetical protein
LFLQKSPSSPEKEYSLNELMEEGGATNIPENKKNASDTKNKEASETELTAEQAQKTQELYEALQEANKIPSWKKAKEEYNKLLQDVKNIENLPTEYQSDLSAKLTKAIEITEENIKEKEFLQEQEREEKKIISKEAGISYEKSVEKWKKMLDQYKKESKDTKIEKYQKIFKQKAQQTKANLFLAKTYAKIKKVSHPETGESWKDSKDIYKKLLQDVRGNKDFEGFGKIELPDAQESSTLDAMNKRNLNEEMKKLKNALIQDLQKKLDISKTNIALKEENQFLVDAEKSIYKLGYRKSAPYWKLMEKKYKKILPLEKNPEQKELLEKKKDEMVQNYEIADLYADLENTKEGSATWKKSQREYELVIQKAEKNKHITEPEKGDLLARAHEYKNIADANVAVKTQLQKVQDEITELVQLDDWEITLLEHLELEERMEKISGDFDESLLSSTQKQNISKISGEISGNIDTCTKEIKEDQEKMNTFNPEVLAQDNPDFAYAYSLFLAVQISKKNKPIAQKTPENISDQLVVSSQNPLSSLPLQEKKKIPENFEYQSSQNQEQEQEADQQDQFCSAEYIETALNRQKQEVGGVSNAQEQKMPENISQPDGENDSEALAPFVVDINPLTLQSDLPADKKYELLNVVKNKREIECVNSADSTLCGKDSQEKKLAESMCNALQKHNEKSPFTASQIRHHLAMVSSQDFNLSDLQKMQNNY